VMVVSEHRGERIVVNFEEKKSSVETV
jgi:hypothetical protein